ncbi:FAD/NAD(P)-binding domain-containing protein [Hyaloscypha variabilis F]|jgi:NADH dehydrogenase FAD-containing subunit|uniref:FAD/NAD(P)-binding domain-containing protein n=1 Tax=Hyaloscypha variabilis (strain UAMH 11265 / GT02V1 / F) TaxID=1149755 RepID=A0A2J6RA07_HYAVF|nr:FAD/NAD(P)-binding domain-containing protein [Hyaloscypha variabilis F]
MPSDKLRVFTRYLPFLLKYGLKFLYQRLQATVHRRTYCSLPSPQTVLVIGGSFTGVWLARRLTESLPSGYKVILIEKNSHFNYLFNFPRYSVLQGHEQQAFIPYQGLFENAPEGIFEQITDEVICVREGDVELRSGKCIQYAYLVIATGATQSPPAKLLASRKGEACAELRVLQTRIKEAERIAVVGGGAVGVQLSADVKSFYPDKKVVLIHSRGQLLSNFGVRLHEYVVGKLAALGVDVLLGERPATPGDGKWESAELILKDGRSELFDLVIPSTGQTPNTSIIAGFAPSSISAQTGRILVKSTLQLEGDGKFDEVFENIFALGDVAETGGPKMASAGMMQGEIVRENILALIRGEQLAEYTPLALEGALKLRLGKDECVMYIQEDDGTDFMFPGKNGNVDLEAAKAWKMFGAVFEEEANE